MKRNMDLVRQILLTLEEDNVAKKSREQITTSIKSYDANLVNHHLQIMAQAGLLKEDRMSFPKSSPPQHSSLPAVTVSSSPIMQNHYSLTWDGHEFINTMRSDTIWKKVKEVISKAGQEFSIDIAVYIAKELLKQNIDKLLE